MFKGETSFEIFKALEFVGDNSTYQKNRLLWITAAIFSCAILNSYIPIVLHSYQSTLFFISSAVGQLVCPLYFNIKDTAKYLLLVSFPLVVCAYFQWIVLETIVFAAIGFLGRGLYVSTFIYLNEIGGEKFRAWSFMVIFTLSGLAPFVLALLTMFKFSAWLIITLVVLLPHALLFQAMRRGWYPSPIECCEVMGDYDKARDILNVIAH